MFVNDFLPSPIDLGLNIFLKFILFQNLSHIEGGGTLSPVYDIDYIAIFLIHFISKIMSY